MAYTSREIEAPAAAVWAVLIDPTTYPDWLVGAQKIRDVDDDWPSVGSRFHHRVGIGPFVLADHTEIVAVEPFRGLDLRVRARPFVAAIAKFRLVADGERTMLSVEEEPEPRLVGNLFRPVMDPATHVRNHRSLARLERLVLDRTVAA